MNKRPHAIQLHRDVCALLNWQIKQREAFIRKNCSFFAFFGAADSFPFPPQANRARLGSEVGATHARKPEGSYVIPRCETQAEPA